MYSKYHVFRIIPFVKACLFRLSDPLAVGPIEHILTKLVEYCQTYEVKPNIGDILTLDNNTNILVHQGEVFLNPYIPIKHIFTRLVGCIITTE